MRQNVNNYSMRSSMESLANMLSLMNAKIIDLLTV